MNICGENLITCLSRLYDHPMMSDLESLAVDAILFIFLGFSLGSWN